MSLDYIKLMKQKIYRFSTRPLVILYSASLLGMAALSYIIFVLQGIHDNVIMFSIGLVVFFILLGILKLMIKPLHNLVVDCRFDNLHLKVTSLEIRNPQYKCVVNFCAFQVVPKEKRYEEVLKFQSEKEIQLQETFGFELPSEYYQPDYKYYLVFFDFNTGRAIISFDITGSIYNFV